MSRKPDKRIEQARTLYLKGLKLVDISKRLDLPEGTVRRWKSTYKWDGERSEKANETNVRKEYKNIKNDKEKAIAEEVEQVIKNPELTDKQRLFCCLYIKCFNATKAYQKAYKCSYEVAMVEGSNALRKPKIKKEIQRLKQNLLNREMLSEEDIFQKYMDIAFADITDYVEFGRETVPVIGPFGPVIMKNEETGEKIKIKEEVNVVRFKKSIEVDGTLITEVKQGKYGASIKLADRMKALEWLAGHMDMATSEQKARIKKLEAETERIRNSGDSESEDDGVEIINDCPQ